MKPYQMGSQQVFDIKMEEFRQDQACHRGHMMEALATIMYAGDILNAYVQAPVTEKVWTTLGPEFGKDARKSAVIVRASYSLKSVGATFKSHLAKCMESLGYLSCEADGLNQKSDQKMGCSISPVYCVMLMTFYASITMQIPCWNGYISTFHLSKDCKPDMYLGVKLCKTRLHNEV